MVEERCICIWLGVEMVKVGERRVACGCGHEKVRGFGHTWIVDSTVEIGTDNTASPMEIIRMELKKGRSMFPLFTIGEVGRLFEHFEYSD